MRLISNFIFNMWWSKNSCLELIYSSVTSKAWPNFFNDFTQAHLIQQNLFHQSAKEKHTFHLLWLLMTSQSQKWNNDNVDDDGIQ